MRSPGRLLLVLLLGLGVATSGAGGALADSSKGSSTPATTSSRAITLPTGERVLPAAQPAAPALAVSPTGGLGGALLSMRLAGHAYAFPVTALPYLGSSLDPGLFEPAALQGAETQGRIPVRLNYQSSTAPSIPGVTLTRTLAGTAQGYLTPSSARSFGAALVRQYLDDRRHGTFGNRGMFAGNLEITAPGATPAPARPLYAMHTLTVRGLDETGKPDTGDSMFAFNVDDSDRFGDQLETQQVFSGGAVKFSLPAGHYALIGYFIGISTAGQLTDVRIVSRPDLLVTKNATTTLDATTATDQVQMVTPRPSVPQDTGFVFRRVPQHGTDLYLDVTLPAGVAVATAGTPAVHTGTLQTYPYQRLISPPGNGVPYQYYLQIPTIGRFPASQTYHVAPTSVATLNTSFYSDIAAQGEFFRVGLFPFDLGEFVLRPGFALTLPVHRIDYVSTGSSLIWFDAFGKYLDASGAPAGGQYAQPRTFVGGRQVSIEWNRYPLHPAAMYSTMLAADPGASTYQPSATREVNKLALWLQPFSDNQQGHVGPGLGTDGTGTYALYQNGKQLAGGDADIDYGRFFTRLAVSPEPATLKLVLNTTRTGPEYVLSTRTQTSWSWRSAPHPGARLPYGWTCYQGSINLPTPPPTHDCDVEPLMTVQYLVNGMSLSGTVSPGLQRLNLRFGHLQASANSAISGATVAVSDDDGTTWRNAQVTVGRNGDATASFTDFGTGFVSLRVSARDAAGGEISETILRAYALSAA